MHPHLFQFGNIIIPTYGVIAALGLVLSLMVASGCARITRLNEDAIWNLGITTIAGTLILSRILLIAQSPRAFLTYPLLMLTLPSVTRWGLLIALASGLGYILVKRMPLLTTLDTVAPATMLLATALHVGDIFTGEDIGTATTASIGHLLPLPGPENGVGLYPVALFAALASLTIATLGIVWLPRRTQAGEVAGVTLASAAAARFLIDGYRSEWSLPQLATTAHLRPDQYLLLALVAVGGVLLLKRKGPTHAL